MSIQAMAVRQASRASKSVIRFRDLGLFCLMAALLGGAFPAVKAGLDFLPPLILGATRFYLAGIFLVGFALVTTDRWRPRTRNDWTAVLAAGVFFVGGMGLLFVGQQFTTSGIAAILFSLIPVLTPVVAWTLLPSERLTRRGLVGILVGFVGVGIVTQPDPASFGQALLGQSSIVLAAVSVTLGSVLIRRSGPTMSMVALTGWAMLIGATIQYGFGVALGESVSMVRFTPAAIGIVLYLAVFASGVGYVLYFVLLERFGPLEVNLVTYVIPVVAVLTGRALLGAPITIGALLGFGVIAAGFSLLKSRELTVELDRIRRASVE